MNELKYNSQKIKLNEITSQLEIKKRELLSVCKVDEVRDSTDNLENFFQILLKELLKIFKVKIGVLFFKNDITNEIEIKASQ